MPKINNFLNPIALAMTAVVLASPAKEKPTKKACAKACSFDYTPVCGGVKDSKDKPISFGNTCVLENYNCENQKSKIQQRRLRHSRDPYEFIICYSRRFVRSISR